jgi:hypothetical protein
VTAPQRHRITVGLATIGLLAACVPAAGCGAGSSGQTSPQRDPEPASGGQPHPEPASGGRPLDPDVVGPRLVRESFGPQLQFWLRTYGARDRVRAGRSWATSDRGRSVTLRLSRHRGGRSPSSLTARWRIAVPLDRDLTSRQVQTLGGRRGIVPANGAARRLSSFPRIDPARGPRSRPLALVARVQDVDARGRRIAVALVPAASVLDGIVTRRGGDLALLAGLTLIEHARLPQLTSVALAPAARITAGSKALIPSGLDAIVVAHPDALAVLRWRGAGRLSLAELLARPVDEIEIVGAPR